MLAGNHVLAGAPPAAAGTGERLPERHGLTADFGAFSDVERQINDDPDDDRRKAEELIECAR